jgi:hypothetical protein
MTTKKLVCAAAVLVLSFPPLASSGTPPPPFETPAAAWDLSEGLLVPAGSVLEGRATADGFRFAAVPASSLAQPGVAVAADCQDDELPAWYPQAFGVPMNPSWPLAVNRADEGECVEQVHEWPIKVLQFQTTGDGIAWIEVHDVDGYFHVACSPRGNVLGAGFADVWRTTFDGNDLWCQIEKRGVEPGQFSRWVAYVYSWHRATGSTTYVSFA